MPPAIRHLLLIFAIFLVQIVTAPAADIPLVLDIHDNHIEAALTIPASEFPSTHADLSAYLQTHLSFTTPGGQPMTFELIGEEQTPPKSLRATLYIYPPDDITPPAFVVSTTALNYRLQILLRRDPAAMRLGIESPLPLGTLDSLKNSLTIEREFPPLTARALAAFISALQLLLIHPTALLILLLLATSLTHSTKTSSAFTHAALAILAFFTGTSIALLFETHLADAPLTVLLIATVAGLSLQIWKPWETTPRIVAALVTGWITSVSWNNTWFPQGSFDQQTLLTFSAATLPALAAITLLAFPTLLLLARQLPPAIFRGAATLCGIIVILLQLTSLARPA